MSGVNLRKADLSEASFAGTDLSDSNFQGANLSKANLSRSRALNTYFQGATFTAACIEDWTINSSTVFDDVACGYIFLGLGYGEADTDYSRSRNCKDYHYRDRRPSSKESYFAPGEFVQLIRKSQSTIDLIFLNGINWQAFLDTFVQIRDQEGTENLSIRAVEETDDGAFVIRINAPPETDKEQLETKFKWFYKQSLEEIEAGYRRLLQEKDERIQDYRDQLQYYRQDRASIGRILETMAENNREITIINTSNQTNYGQLNTMIGKAEDKAQVTINETSFSQQSNLDEVEDLDLSLKQRQNTEDG